MKTYEKNLHINDETFDAMREDADRVMQRLLKNMIEKGSLEGKLTITIDVSLTADVIPNRDPKIEGETRRVLSPKIAHKVSSVMQIKSEEKGDKNYAGMELVYDSVTGEYVMVPIANTDQMTIYDVDYTEVESASGEVVDEDGNPIDTENEPEALEGRKVLELEGPTEEEFEDDDTETFNEEETEVDEEDLSDEFEDEELPVPFDEENDDDYGYEEPGEDEF